MVSTFLPGISEKSTPAYSVYIDCLQTSGGAATCYSYFLILISDFSHTRKLCSCSAPYHAHAVLCCALGDTRDTLEPFGALQRVGNIILIKPPSGSSVTKRQRLASVATDLSGLPWSNKACCLQSLSLQLLFISLTSKYSVAS